MEMPDPKVTPSSMTEYGPTSRSGGGLREAWMQAVGWITSPPHPLSILKGMERGRRIGLAPHRVCAGVDPSVQNSGSPIDILDLDTEKGNAFGFKNLLPQCVIFHLVFMHFPVDFKRQL